MTDKKLITLPTAKLAIRTVLLQLKVPGDHEFLATHLASAVMVIGLPYEPTAMVKKSEYDLLLAKYNQLELINAKIAGIAGKAGD